MQVDKYIFSGETFQGEMIFHFLKQNGCLVFYQNSAEMSAEQWVWFLDNFPTTYEKLQYIAFKSKACTIKPIEMDLSFDNFWDTYDYKVGNKKRAQKLWEKMSEAQKIKSFESLPGYNYYLMTRGIEKAYPETFLAQERYEVDYKALIRKK
jgi:hypothetical protein